MSDTTALAVIPSTGVETYRMSTDAAGICGAIVKQTAMNIQGKKYVKVEGWQAIAIAHGCVASSLNVERVEDGFRATGEVRRMSDGGLISQAEGFLGDDEPMWAKRPLFARRAMVQTRAISRACRSAFAHVVVLIDKDLSTTPAEEMQGVIDHEPNNTSNGQSRALEAAAADIAAATGNAQSTYQINKAKNAPAAAKAWADKQISVFGMMASVDEIDAWWTENFTATDKLEANHPAEHKRLTDASENRRDELAARAA